MPRRNSRKTKIQIGNKSLTYGSKVLPATDSSDLYKAKNFDALRLRLELDGYIFVRNVIPQNAIFAARSLMLEQAFKDGSIVVNEELNLNDARITRVKNRFADGYCIDAYTGSETGITGNRIGMDDNAWQTIGDSDIVRNVYQSRHLIQFWKNLFNAGNANHSRNNNNRNAEKINSLQPLTKETFLRLMGSSSTQEHADYYYFKRDTQIFDAKHGRNAQLAMKQYLMDNELWNTDIYEIKQRGNRRSIEDDECLHCTICEKEYSTVSDLSVQYMKRQNMQDFGVEGNWHCPACARLPLAIYTTWISLSDLQAPKDSILALCPKSHLLKEWDSPQRHLQLPGDFKWSMPWVIPKSISYGDIILFNIKTIHASSKNMSTPRKFRCSFDTRIHLSPVKQMRQSLQQKMSGMALRSRDW